MTLKFPKSQQRRRRRKRKKRRRRTGRRRRRRRSGRSGRRRKRRRKPVPWHKVPEGGSPRSWGTLEDGTGHPVSQEVSVNTLGPAHSLTGLEALKLPSTSDSPGGLVKRQQSIGSRAKSF